MRFNQSDLDKNYNRASISPKASPVFTAFFSLIAVFLLYQIVGGTLTYIIFGLDFRNSDLTSLRLMTMAGQVLFILLPALIISKAVYENVTFIIRAYKTTIAELILFTIGFIIITFLVQSYLVLQLSLLDYLAEKSPLIFDIKVFLDNIDKSMSESYIFLLTSDSFLDIILIIMVVAITPAFAEEVFFRGLIQNSLEFKYNALKASILSACFFALYHFNFYGLLPLIGLGVYFGYAAYKSGSIIIPIFLHFFNNFIAILSFLVSGKEELIETKIASSEEMITALIVMAGSIMLLYVFMIIVRKFYLRKLEDKGNVFL